STKHLMLDNWLLIYATYDRPRRILEICFNHGTRHQYRNVPLQTALALVRASDPAHYWKRKHRTPVSTMRSSTRQLLHGMGDSDGNGEGSRGTYRFERVRVWGRGLSR